ncbi:MAG: hypothetical protein HFH49_02075 [Lachnospiraceae bacterium]|nr:hypothetical protein [Lachnospiraceae bacterium]
MREFLKNISYSLTANVISMLVGILSVLVFPKFIGVDEFGYYQLYIFYISYVTLTAFGWADGVYLKYGGWRFEDLPFSKLNTQFWMLALSQGVLYMFLFLGAGQVGDYEKRCIFFVVCIGALIVHMRYFLYLILQASNQMKAYAECIITERLFSVLGGLLALLLGYRGYLLLIALDVAGRFLSLLIILKSCRKIVFQVPKFKREELAEAGRFMMSGSMVLFAALASSMVIGIVRYAIEAHWDITAFSKVSLTISISNMATRCINAVGIVMFPTLRRIPKEQLQKIYGYLNCGLTVFIFGMLTLYQPAAFLLKMWLPQYADSIKYAAILLPVCAYECKNVMLVSAYLKTLFADKILLLINGTSILLSLGFTIVTVFVLNSIEMAVLSMLISLMTRCILGELYLGQRLKMQMWQQVWREGLLAALFIFCNWSLGWIGTVFYAAGFAVYCMMMRQKLRIICQFLHEKIHKKR